MNYSVSDGLICNDTNVHAILKLQNGNILIGTPQGYQTIIPQDILTTSYDANIYLTGIELKSGMTHPDILNGSSLECDNIFPSLKRKIHSLCPSLPSTWWKRIR